MDVEEEKREKLRRFGDKRRGCRGRGFATGSTQRCPLPSPRPCAEAAGTATTQAAGGKREGPRTTCRGGAGGGVSLRVVVLVEKSKRVAQR